ncbi:MAG: hypothetical protein WC314_21700, partial [Vulcanimicrobiota bacterium]
EEVIGKVEFDTKTGKGKVLQGPQELHEMIDELNEHGMTQAHTTKTGPMEWTTGWKKVEITHWKWYETSLIGAFEMYGFMLGNEVN